MDSGQFKATRSEDWLTSFKVEGYYHFSQLLSPELISKARVRIDQDLAKNFDPTRQVEYDNQSYCPKVRNSREIMGLVRSAPVQRVLDLLVDSNQLDCDLGQIAIRRAYNSVAKSPPHPHIDGIPTPDNGMQGSELSPFTLLIGVFMNEVVSDFAGNFTVWPGSHLRLESYFRERGEVALREGMPQIPLGTPKQLHCKIGDVVICHYQVAHAAAVNTSGNDRYAVFFRLWHHELDQSHKTYSPGKRWEHLTHLWTGWKIVPNAAPQQRLA